MNVGNCHEVELGFDKVNTDMLNDTKSDIKPTLNMVEQAINGNSESDTVEITYQALVDLFFPPFFLLQFLACVNRVFILSNLKADCLTIKEIEMSFQVNATLNFLTHIMILCHFCFNIADIIMAPCL